MLSIGYDDTLAESAYLLWQDFRLISARFIKAFVLAILFLGVVVGLMGAPIWEYYCGGSSCPFSRPLTKWDLDKLQYAYPLDILGPVILIVLFSMALRFVFGKTRNQNT